MCGELCPPNHTLSIKVRLIIKMMWLMSIAKCIKSDSFQPLHTSQHLFFTECMALPKLMLILTYSIEEGGNTIEEKASVMTSRYRTFGSKTLHRPAKGTNTKRRGNFVRSFARTFNHRSQFIKIRLLRTPTARILHRRLLANYS